MAEPSKNHAEFLPLLLLLLLLWWLWRRRKPVASTGVSYYTQQGYPGVATVTEASFDAMNPANIDKLNAFPSSLVNYPGRGGAPRGVYDAVVWARANGLPLGPYLDELNAALSSIYG